MKVRFPPLLQPAVKCVTYLDTNLKRTVKIRFPDANLQRIFNTYASLQVRYGEDLAIKIAVRMNLLSAARHLGQIPQQPPIRLKPIDGSGIQYTVDLILPHRLRFGALISKSSLRAQAKHVEEIQILAVD